MAAIINFVDVAAALTSHNLDLDLFPVTQADDIHAKKRDDKIFIAGEQTRATSYCPTLCPDTARRIQCNVT